MSIAPPLARQNSHERIRTMIAWANPLTPPAVPEYTKVHRARMPPKKWGGRIGAESTRFDSGVGRAALRGSPAHARKDATVARSLAA